MKLFFTAVLCAASCYAANAQELFQLPAGTDSRVSSFENLNGRPGQGGLTNNGAKGNAFESLKAGESKTLLELNACGTIRRIWCTIADRSPAMLRSLRLRMYWDGSVKPAVDVPFGDFFCAGLGRPVAFESAMFTDPEGKSFNCYIPMPFKKAAKIVLTNESGKVLNALFFDIDYTTEPDQPKDMLWFHACWNRSIRSIPGKDFELLPRITGSGRFLGACVGVNVDSVYGHTWWGEGEVKMYIDQDSSHPTINGTGAEDYIGTGWGEGVFSHLYQGCLISDVANRQYVFYRFHIPDPVYFHTGFHATIQEIGGGFAEQVTALKAGGVPLIPITIAGERAFIRLLDSASSSTGNGIKGWMNFYRTDDYSATSYFYLDKPDNNLQPLASVDDRIPK